MRRPSDQQWAYLYYHHHQEYTSVITVQVLWWLMSLLHQPCRVRPCHLAMGWAAPPDKAKSLCLLAHSCSQKPLGVKAPRGSRSLRTDPSVALARLKPTFLSMNKCTAEPSHMWEGLKAPWRERLLKTRPRIHVSQQHTWWFEARFESWPFVQMCDIIKGI